MALGLANGDVERKRVKEKRQHNCRPTLEEGGGEG